jgi:hypothetical protein
MLLIGTGTLSVEVEVLDAAGLVVGSTGISDSASLAEHADNRRAPKISSQQKVRTMRAGYRLYGHIQSGKKSHCAEPAPVIR